jgi:hypothetical protein
VSTCPEHITNSIPTTSYAEADHEVNRNWELVSSRHSCEKIEKRFTLPNSKTVSTTNRFSMLAGISESDRSDNALAAATRQEAPNIINKHQNSANRPASFKTPHVKPCSTSGRRRRGGPSGHTMKVMNCATLK